MTTVKEAKETKIFIIEDERIRATTLYDFVMISAEETTSPRGVENKLHIREKEQQCSCYNTDNDTYDGQCPKCYMGVETVYEVWNWGFRGQFPKLIETFDTVTQAEDFIFDRTYQYDFLEDCCRSIFFCYTYDEAMDDLIQTMMDRYYIDRDVAVSVIHHMDCVEKIKEKQAMERIQQAQEQKEKRERLVEIYSEGIERIEGEKFKETANRVSQLLGERIDSSIFWLIVKKVRRE